MEKGKTELETVEPDKKSKAPVLAGNRGITFQSMEEMFRFCQAVVNSGQFRDINTPEIALIRLQAGMELGLSPIWSLTNIFVVNGRPACYGDALLGLVLNHPDCQDVVETFEGGEKTDNYSAVCEVHRKGRLPVKRTFSVADAKKAGLWAKAGPWSQYASRMLQMRARSWACRDAFADALRGLGVVEELRDVTSQPDKEQIKREVKAKLVLPDETVIDGEGAPVKEPEPEPVAAKPRSGDELFPTGDES